MKHIKLYKLYFNDKEINHGDTILTTFRKSATEFITEDADYKAYDKFFDKLPNLDENRDGRVFFKYFKSYISNKKESNKDVYLLYDLSDDQKKIWKYKYGYALRGGGDYYTKKHYKNPSWATEYWFKWGLVLIS